MSVLGINSQHINWDNHCSPLCLLGHETHDQYKMFSKSKSRVVATLLIVFKDRMITFPLSK